ncbi:MAG: aminodeoxychorismate synthase component I [Pseudomonadota bacterium]
MAVLIENTDAELDLASLHAAAPAQFPFYLASVGSQHAATSADILFALPQGELKVTAGATGDFMLSSTIDVVQKSAGDSFFECLNRWASSERSTPSPSTIPFIGGWFLYLSYEAAAIVEPSLQISCADKQRVASAHRIPAAVIRCHDHDGSPTCYFVAETDALMSELRSAVCNAVSQPHTDVGELPSVATLTEDPPSQFIDAVVSAKSAIADGDIYQANLSRQWSAPMHVDAAPLLFSALTKSNPAPFSAIARFDDMTIVSSSPERLVKVEGREVSTRPIAGTRPRGKTDASDSALIDELIGSRKEQAEHVMLIDLERNDLGRVCEAGSVVVDEFMVIESFAHVHHIVSNVKGTLQEQIGPGDVLKALFPGGTITGCPKVRCMQIIGELERAPRGAYTGSLGYLSRDGDMDMNILIRTMTLQSGELSFRAGAGIVADSSPEAELRETRAKAEGLINALRKDDQRCKS